MAMPGAGEQKPGDTVQPAGDPAPLRAVHSTNFPELLRRLGAALLVTIYQAGKLVIVRDEGDHLNAHFRTFDAPMGLAVDGDRLAIGTRIQVWEYVDVPAVAARIEGPRRQDACFLPRSSQTRKRTRIRFRGDGLLPRRQDHRGRMPDGRGAMGRGGT